ncbi:tumor necrosis factor ligand superfamily member 11-like isoform X2 [Brachyhypopomus gauderio]|uniref:tumor necrosis factor ligand superfamily member 11-like isoform X2 n=1 Tax=Brachyhypopomus gauderio TaxID=698409 RepID=UPI0040411331
MPVLENIDAKTCKLELQQHRPTLPHERTPVYVALAIIGFMQVISTVTVLLHLSGHIPQMYSSTELQRPSEVVLNESVPNEQVRTAAKSRKHKSIVPAAHLPVRPTSRNTQRDVHANVIHWNPDQGSLHHFGYHNGRVLVEESGLYYVYAKTCFRYYDIIEVASETEQDSQSNGPPTISPSDAGMQLVQYVFREHVSRGRSGPVLLMKSGHTWHWKQGTWHTCCQRQSGVFALQSGDGLYVSILNIWVLDPDTEGSYFGAFMVSGEQ